MRKFLITAVVFSFASCREDFTVVEVQNVRIAADTIYTYKLKRQDGTITTQEYRNKYEVNDKIREY